MSSDDQDAGVTADICAISRDDLTAALESINYHYIVMAQAAAKWRRKRPPDVDAAEDCERRCTELEALYRRIHDRLAAVAPGAEDAP